MSQTQDSAQALSDRLAADAGGTPIPVPISYEIIHLFSEGLYQSPHKAIEELVANSFDAGANLVSVLVPPRAVGDSGEGTLWVIDDGCGMDDVGFHQLWRVAESPKSGGEAQYDRKPIGQFGIGKLAAFVLAWRLAHISKSTDGQFRYASMDFHSVMGRRLNEPNAEPVKVRLHRISERDARELLRDVETADPFIWDRLFGSDPAPTWTAASLSDFKDLFGKLSEGRLSWVLRTGLPLVSNFEIHLNGERLPPSRETRTVLHELVIGGQEDKAARTLGLACTDGGVEIPGIGGVIRGKARIFEAALTKGKADQYGRSHGFFVRVRGRVINLEDELFGLGAHNHAAWARFAMEIEADGLREHLLSSREGVRESDPIRMLRVYLHRCFNVCRVVYDKSVSRDLLGIELASILNEAPSLALNPLLDAIRAGVLEGPDSLYYIRTRRVEDAETWLREAGERLKGQAFRNFAVTRGDPWERLCAYDPETDTLSLNGQHPYAAKVIVRMNSDSTPAKLIAISEIVTDALLRTSRLPTYEVHDLLDRRDRILRRLAGQQALDVPTVIRQLGVANAEATAMEHAVGHAFAMLGFDYEPRGGSGNPDGILRARLGRGTGGDRSFAVVYETKTSAAEALPASRLDLQALRTHAVDEGAQYSLVVGRGFESQDDPDGSLNKRIKGAVQGGHMVTVIRTEDLVELVKLHYRFGLTFSDLQNLFEDAHTLPETREWVSQRRQSLESGGPIPLRTLLDALEAEQADPLAKPNLIAARSKHDALKRYEPEKLEAAVKAAATLLGERWLAVDRQLNVNMGHSAAEISEEFKRRLATGIDNDAQTVISGS